MLSSLMFSLIFGVGMFSFEIARVERARASLQGAADASAVAAAKELPVLGGSEIAMTAVARGVAERNLGLEPGASLPESTDPVLQVTAAIEMEGRGVHIELRRNAPMFFGKLVNIADPWIIADATAELFGESKICVIALQEDGRHGIEMHGSARISGNGCGIFANSRDPDAIHVFDSALLEAPLICAGGGYKGNDSNFGSRPVTDCPPQPDPLEGRVVTPDTACTFTGPLVLEGLMDPATNGLENKWIDGLDPWAVVKPGVYCGGLDIRSHHEVWFEPGVYVIKDGPLKFSSTARARGENVAFHFTGDGAQIEFLDDAGIELSAPETGPLAGILFYESKGETVGTPAVHTMTSPNVSELIGTVYVPRSQLYIATDQPVAQESAFTVIIAESIKMELQPHLVLNTDYEATNVPVPDGIVKTGSAVRLTR